MDVAEDTKLIMKENTEELMLSKDVVHEKKDDVMSKPVKEMEELRVVKDIEDNKLLSDVESEMMINGYELKLVKDTEEVK